MLVIPAFIWTPVLLIALASWRFPALRRALDAIPLAALVGFHAIRAVIGGAFLIYAAQGLLTPRFALPAGYGDIAVGLLAIPIAVRAARRADAGSQRLVFVWNLFGLLDILLTFVSAQRILLFGEGPARAARVLRLSESADSLVRGAAGAAHARADRAAHASARSLAPSIRAELVHAEVERPRREIPGHEH